MILDNDNVSLDRFLDLVDKNTKNLVSQSDVLLSNYLPRSLVSENSFDFLYGWLLGHVQASQLDLFRETYGRLPTREEFFLMMEYVEKYAVDIKNSIVVFQKSF